MQKQPKFVFKPRNSKNEIPIGWTNKNKGKARMGMQRYLSNSLREFTIFLLKECFELGKNIRYGQNIH